MKTSAALVIVALMVAPDLQAQSLRIATYNVNWANGRGDAVLDAIATAKPDLICFQETTPRSERFLREQLRDTFPHFHAAGHQRQYAAERFAFASKIKLTDLTFVPPAKGLFGFYVARFRLDETAVHVVNVHLSPFQPPPGGGIRELMAELSTTEEKHASEITAIIDAIDANQPTIIAGDFNSLSTFVAPQKLKEIGLLDAFASVHDDADDHPTWEWPTRPLALRLRIDYIFHTKHFTAADAKVIRRDGSDHSLVVAELRLGEQGAVADSTFEAGPDR